MKYSDFERTINGCGALPHVYLLHGDEPYFIGAAEKLLLDKLLPDMAARGDSLVQLDGESDPSVLEQEIGAVPFFGDCLVIIVRGTKIFGDKNAKGQAAATDDSLPFQEEAARKKKKAAKAQYDPLDGLMTLLAAMPETNYVIFELPFAADKRRKAYKAIEKTALVLDAAPLRPWDAAPWLDAELKKRGLALDFAAREYITAALANLQDVPLGYLANEAEKLSLYLASFGKKPDGKKLIAVTKDEIAASFARLPEISGFAIAEAIDQRDAARALRLLNEELAAGTFLPLIVALLVRRVREYTMARALLKQGKRGRDLSAALGQRSYYPAIVEKLLRAANAHDDDELKEIYLKLAEADYRLKTGGAGAELLEEIIIALCRKKARGRK